MPKSGFINVLDFKSPKQLAYFLIYLDQNKTAYNSYFEWKSSYRFATPMPNFFFIPFCEMCIKLNLERFSSHIQTKVLTNVKEFFDSQSKCKKPFFRKNNKNNEVYFELKNFTSFDLLFLS